MKRGVERGISPLIATIILIAITVAIGATIYSYVSSMSGVLGTQLSIQVQSIDLIKTSQGTVLFSITVKNTGNKPITSCTVTLWADNGEVQAISIGSIDPGQAKSTTVTNPTLASGSPPPAAQFTVGKTYPVKISATAADGSRFDRSMTVTCSS